MSFFDSNKNVGLALIIVGILSIIFAAAGAAVAFADNYGEAVAFAVGAIGSIIFGILILFFGIKVRSGSNDKVGILSGLVRVLGIATILGAIFIAISAAMISSVAAGVVVAIVQIVIGLILLWIATKIAGANKNIISKVLWVLLVLAFLILAILSLIAFLIGLIGNLWVALSAVSSICSFIIYVYAFLACLSPEVKNSMGV